MIDSDRVTITPKDANYPPQLLEMDAPPTLRVAGDPSVLLEPCVAVIGARKCTPYGRHCARESGMTAALHDMVTINGGAIGIDAEALEGALEWRGKCAVVLGGGLDHPYPAANADLFDRIIAEGGAIVSPYPDDMPPTPGHFRARCEVMGRIGFAVVNVESALPSGTYATCDAAAARDSPLLAFPGNINSPQSAGCNEMISLGIAQCITSSSDLADRLTYLRVERS